MELVRTSELEGIKRRRAIHPVWSVTVHKVEHAVVKSGESVLYYLVTMPAAGESAFVRQELRLVPIGTIDTEALP